MTPRIMCFDAETNGFLDDLDTIHCLVIWDSLDGRYHQFVDRRQLRTYADPYAYADIFDGLELLHEADVIVAHNGIKFDNPAIRKVFSGWNPKGLVRDTLVLTKLFWPHIGDGDTGRIANGTLPGKLWGSHKLEAWGYRMGTLKDEYQGGWEAWSPEMQSYCVQDVRVLVALWERCVQQAEKLGLDMFDPVPPPRKDCIQLEHEMCEITRLIQEHGFKFNEQKAVALTATLSQRKQELVGELQLVFHPLEIEEPFVPKVNNKTRGYVKGETFIKRRTIDFNPGSRKQVADRLLALGWKPLSFGKDGTPTVDDEILSALPYPEAKPLAEYFLVDKRLGQIANGTEAWLRHNRRGRIHGHIDSGGTHTGRAAHSRPNIGQVPKVGSPYGSECREMFEADSGWVLVGCDMAALELRDLAGYMARYDDGAYIKTILEGNSADGTDMHTLNAKALGCTRNVAKTYFYAMIYGAGDEKLGVTLGGKSKRECQKLGKESRKKLAEGVPALGALIEAVGGAVDGKGYLTGVDGRRLVTRRKNSALNTLLQSAGAVQCKRWIVGFVEIMGARHGLRWGQDYAIVAWVHDEIQVTCRKDIADIVVQVALAAAELAGEFYSFRCPLAGDAKIGLNWKETH